MSAGLEIRGKSLRIWMRPEPTEPVIKETLDWEFTLKIRLRRRRLPITLNWKFNLASLI